MRDGQTEGQTDGRMQWNQYTSQQLRCGGYNDLNYDWSRWSVTYSQARSNPYIYIYIYIFIYHQCKSIKQFSIESIWGNQKKISAHVSHHHKIILRDKIIGRNVISGICSIIWNNEDLLSMGSLWSGSTSYFTIKEISVHSETISTKISPGWWVLFRSILALACRPMINVTGTWS